MHEKQRETKRTRDGIAELRVELPHGKASRMVTVELTADECLRLADSATRAARLLLAEGGRP